jgi:hypothetical protein
VNTLTSLGLSSRLAAAPTPMASSQNRARQDREDDEWEAEEWEAAADGTFRRVYAPDEDLPELNHVATLIEGWTVAQSSSSHPSSVNRTRFTSGQEPMAGPGMRWPNHSQESSSMDLDEFGVPMPVQKRGRSSDAPSWLGQKVQRCRTEAVLDAPAQLSQEQVAASEPRPTDQFLSHSQASSLDG